ncbi:MAG: glycosyltransferase [Chloroflexi bacterium]|nr:glycosyltransferase [Chloroflexota bacterium]
MTDAPDAPVTARRRAVVLVGNPAAPYSRALRIARTLQDIGFDVEIAAVASADVPDHEADGSVTIRRYRPSGPFAFLAAGRGAASSAPSSGPWRSRPAPLRIARSVAAALRRWALWPHTVRGWWATLDRDLAPADLYHACGSLTVAAAIAARGRDRRAGRTSRVLYDAIDDVVDGNNLLGVPAPVKAVMRRRETRWARSADARITVNEALAARLATRWRTERPLVVPNWPDVRGPATLSGGAPDLIRAALGVPPTTRIVVFQGRLGPNLGLDAAAQAILEVPDAVLCLIGFGRGFAASRARDDDPRFAGRHRTLPAVHPDEIVAWAASADVALVPLPPVSANQRASTPNKFWEALAAGTPIVLGPDLPEMARILLADELGVVARSLRPGDLAAAIRTVLDVRPEVAVERRTRIAAMARDRYSWPRAARDYRSLIARLVGSGGSADPTAQVVARRQRDAAP